MGSVKEVGKRNGSVFNCCGCGVRWNGGQVGWQELVAASGELVGVELPPLLEEAHPLAATVGAPEVAAAGRGVAAVAGPVVAVAAPPNTGAPENVDQRRSSETTSSKSSLSSCSCSNVSAGMQVFGH